MSLELDDIILMAFDEKASDVFIKSDTIPSMRKHGKVGPMDLEPLAADEVTRLCYSKMKPSQREIFEQHHEMDLAFAVGDQLRIRMNIYMQRGGVATVCRLIPTRIRSLEELGVPAKVKEFTTHKNGLVLVTGPTGSGKTTTLAAMIDLINASRQVNIITLEDPIEFAHVDKKAIVSQREIGLDTENFNVALKHVLRQAPDIILIGEMRDLETMNIAVTAAETGHLVFATVHTASAAETLDRISNMYAPHERPMLWLRLSTALRGVLSQKLVPTADGLGRVAAIEVMDVTPTIVNLLEKGQADEIYNAIRVAGTEAYWGMQTMNQALLEFYKAGKITEQDAIANGNPVTEMRQMIRMAMTRGEVGAQSQQTPQIPGMPSAAPGRPQQQAPGVPSMPQQGYAPPQQQQRPAAPAVPPIPGQPRR